MLSIHFLILLVCHAPGTNMPIACGVVLAMYLTDFLIDFFFRTSLVELYITKIETGMTDYCLLALHHVRHVIYHLLTVRDTDYI